jgi:hypothetical protein
MAGYTTAMSSSITFVLTHQPDADRILDAFEEQSGLASEDPGDGTRVYPLEGADHGVKVVQTLTRIDEHWTDHLALQAPS